MIDSELKEINSKFNKAKILYLVSFLLGIGLTLFGTISIVSLLMYLKEELEFNYLACFSISLILPHFYSIISNLLLNKVENKIDDVLLEADILEEKKKEKLISRYGIDNIKERFEKLSRDNQLRLLYSVKDYIPIDNYDLNINNIDCYIIMSLMQNDGECLDSELIECYGKNVKKRVNNK